MKSKLVGILMLLFVIYKIVTFGPPEGKIQETRYLKIIATVIDVEDVVGCSGKNNGVFFEHCILRVEPDLIKIESALLKQGWVVSDNKRFGREKIGAWCKRNGTMYIGAKDNEWELLYAEDTMDYCK